MKIDLEMGDRSHDGHGRYALVKFESNLTMAEVKKAFIKGKKKVGFDITTLASDYGDSLLPQENLDSLIELGFKHEFECTGTDGAGLEPSDMAIVYLFTCKQGNSDFKYKIVKDEAPTISIGGYGLFQ